MNEKDIKQDLPKLVYVYLGKKIPKYVAVSLRNTKLRFPHLKLVLIHNSIQGESLARKLEIQSFMTKNWLLSSDGLSQKLNHPLEFRGGFWFYTLARFFALHDYQANENTPLIQIEADVWLADNFPFSKFALLPRDIAFPMESENKGAASILWLRDRDASSKLKDFAVNSIQEIPDATDMTILGDLIKRKPEIATTLPVLPSIEESQNLSISFSDSIFSRNFALFGGVFDALSYGMYLIGTDPRNSRGWSFLFKKQPDHKVPIPGTLFSSDSNNNLNVKMLDKEFPLFNLHNHAKLTDVWSLNTQPQLSKITADSNQGKPRKHFYPRVFIACVMRSLARRTRRLCRLFVLSLA